MKDTSSEAGSLRGRSDERGSHRAAALAGNPPPGQERALCALLLSDSGPLYGLYTVGHTKVGPMEALQCL